MKILIIKTSALGDILQTFPVISYLRNKFPTAQIDWVAESSFTSLLQSHPDIYEVFPVYTRQWRRFKNFETAKSYYRSVRKTSYDLIFDLQGNTKSALLMACSRGKKRIGFGYRTVPEKPNLLFTNMRFDPPKRQNIVDDYLFLVKSALQDDTAFTFKSIKLKLSDKQKKQTEKILQDPFLQNKKKVMVCPGSNWKSKQIPIPALKGLLRHFQKKTACVFLFTHGSESEKQVAKDLSQDFCTSSLVLPSMEIAELQNLMAAVDLVISADSMPLHLSATTATPSWSVFGPSSGQKYAPQNSLFYQGSCPYGQVFEKRCQLLRKCQDAPCMRLLSSENLIKVFMS